MKYDYLGEDRPHGGAPTSLEYKSILRWWRVNISVSRSMSPPNDGLPDPGWERTVRSVEIWVNGWVLELGFGRSN